jgi:hypothetical protein
MFNSDAGKYVYKPLVSNGTGSTKTTKQFDAHSRNDYGKYVHLHKTTQFQN